MFYSDCDMLNNKCTFEIVGKKNGKGKNFLSLGNMTGESFSSEGFERHKED